MTPLLLKAGWMMRVELRFRNGESASKWSRFESCRSYHPFEKIGWQDVIEMFSPLLSEAAAIGAAMRR
jgi:hypothetical protein